MTAKVFGRAIRGCKMETCHSRRQAAIQLLGKRLLQITGTKARFHVGYRDPLVKRRQRAAKRGRGVALSDRHVGFFKIEYRLQPGKNARCRADQGLARRHKIEIVMRLYAENG